MGFTSAIAPQVRVPLVTGQGTISRARYFAQTELSFVLGTAESLLRAVMSADRHLAIHRPLRYPALLSPRLCPVLGCAAGPAASASSRSPAPGCSPYPSGAPAAPVTRLL